MNCWVECPHCGEKIDATGGIKLHQKVVVLLPRARTPEEEKEWLQTTPSDVRNAPVWEHTTLEKGGDPNWIGLWQDIVQWLKDRFWSMK